MIVIIGTPDSGKSALAEKTAQALSCGKPMAYIATMVPFDEAGEERIKKHRKYREGKAFVTFEEPIFVGALGARLRSFGFETALLECVSNLAGNVLYAPENQGKTVETLTEEIFKEIVELDRQIPGLVVVANYFALSENYDAETQQYITLNNMVSDRLKGFSEKYALQEGGKWQFYENH